MRRLVFMGLSAGGMAAKKTDEQKRAIEFDVPRDQVIAAAPYTVHDNILKLPPSLKLRRTGR